MNPSYTNPTDDANAGGTNPVSPPGVSTPEQVAPSGVVSGQGAQGVQNGQPGQATPASVASMPATPVSPSPMSAMPQNMPITSGTGDIILGGSAPEKKSRKGLIALIVAAVLLVLVGGGLLLWQSGVFGGGNKPSAELTSKLREVINYMYSGEESDAPLAEIPEDAEFKFVTEFNSDDYASRSEYFEKAKTLHGETMEVLLNNKSDAKSNYNALLTDIELSLNRVTSIAMIDGISVEDLKNNYSRLVSSDELNKKIDEHYKELLSSNNEDLKFYGHAYIDYLKMKNEEMALILSNNCLDYVDDLDEFDGLERCANSEKLFEALEEIENKKGTLGYTPSSGKWMADEMVNSDIESLISSYKQLDMELNK